MEPPSSSPSPPAGGYALQPLGRLAPEEVLQHYEELTFPPISRRLAARPGPAGAWRGVVALSEAGPVGLALVETGARDAAQLISLAVLPGHRRRGLGAALVAGVEDLARDAGASAIEGAYRTSWRERRAVETLLQSGGWSPPETRLVLARGEAGVARHLLRIPAPELPEEAEIFAWEELSTAERDRILERQRQDPWFPEILTPFQEEPRLEPAISVGLRWQSEVAGWMICHRVAFDTLQYSAFFVREDLRERGLGWALLREAVRRRLADPDLRHAILAVDARNRRMLDLVRDRLRPYLARTSELRVSRKRLDG